jgi:hypothetical protein
MLKNKTRKDTHVKFYKVIIASVLMYGSENWALNSSERRKIETVEIHFIRRISGYALTDHVYSMTICSALQIYALEERIQDYKNKWNKTS